MTKRSLAALAMALGVASLGGIAGAQTISGRPPVGLWLTENHEGVIRIAPCGQNLCGNIVGESAAEGPPIAGAAG